MKTDIALLGGAPGGFSPAVRLGEATEIGPPKRPTSKESTL